jgi:hypothetical protein
MLEAKTPAPSGSVPLAVRAPRPRPFLLEHLLDISARKRLRSERRYTRSWTSRSRFPYRFRWRSRTSSAGTTSDHLFSFRRPDILSFFAVFPSFPRSGRTDRESGRYPSGFESEEFPQAFVDSLRSRTRTPVQPRPGPDETYRAMRKARGGHPDQSPSSVSGRYAESRCSAPIPRKWGCCGCGGGWQAINGAQELLPAVVQVTMTSGRVLRHPCGNGKFPGCRGGALFHALRAHPPKSG